MQPPEQWRAFDSGDRAIRVQTLPNGDFLVNIQSGAVTMAITVPAADITFLFPAADAA